MNNYDDLLNNTPDNGQSERYSKEEYAAMKKAEREEVFALSDEAAMEVAGDGDKFKQYLDTQARFDRYSAVNTLLIMAQNPDATKLGDFDFWKKHGGSVKPGQKGIAILEPYEYVKDDGSAGTGYKIKKVFDISQIEKHDIKAEAAPKYTDRQIVNSLISKAPVKITGVDKPDGGLGAVSDPETGEISVRKGMPFTETFIGVAQELGYHEANSDANKIPANPFFVGYCSAYLLCKKYGVDTRSFDFSVTPDVFMESNMQGVKQELSLIRDAAGAISGRMARQLEAQQKAAVSQEAR